MKRLVLVVVAAIATAVAPLAVASASSHKTSHKTVSLSGGQSVSVTCSGKSLSVTKFGQCSSARLRITASQGARNSAARHSPSRHSPSRHNSRPDAAAEERSGGSQAVPEHAGLFAAGSH